MTITLRPDTQRLLEERLRQGIYSSPETVVHAALHALNEQESLTLDEQTLDAIDAAEEQIERGECRDWRQVREEVRAKFLGK